jgi:hypothetical protein
MQNALSATKKISASSYDSFVLHETMGNWKINDELGGIAHNMYMIKI